MHKSITYVFSVFWGRKSFTSLAVSLGNTPSRCLALSLWAGKQPPDTTISSGTGHASTSLLITCIQTTRLIWRLVRTRINVISIQPIVRHLPLYDSGQRVKHQTSPRQRRAQPLTASISRTTGALWCTCLKRTIPMRSWRGRLPCCGTWTTTNATGTRSQSW